MQHRKLVYRVVRQLQERPGYTLVVVVNTLNRKVVVAGTLARDGGAGAEANSTAWGHPGIKERKINDTTTAVPAGRSQGRVRNLEAIVDGLDLRSGGI